ncbi:uncharacterized protein PAC_14782 [Phialocephala subalpina]|uniref:Uncharacterized protein n=1 Tax=Phialocephala subalpina TaxID=576137 RepID=A0A1L7XIL8_9HELO|nr:uncharacterized protein PAC_14782 [Phialocephala subalpina]
MSGSLPISPQEQRESTLTPSIPDGSDPVAVLEAPDLDAPRYEAVLLATRHLNRQFSWDDAKKAFLVIEIEELARIELKKVWDEIEKGDKNWNPEYYHRREVLKCGHTTNPDTPDAFFSRHASTKARLILRLASKTILHKVKQLMKTPSLVRQLISSFDKEVLHDQIENYIELLDKNATKTSVELLDKNATKKRKQTTDQKAASKRQLTGSSNQESLRQLQIPSAGYLSYAKNISQLENNINRAQALPAIASLHPELNFPHRNLPSPPTTRRVTAEEDNLAHDHAFHPGPTPYYQNQQNLQSELWHPHMISLAYDFDRFYLADAGGGASAAGTTNTAGGAAAGTTNAAGGAAAGTTNAATAGRTAGRTATGLL